MFKKIKGKLYNNYREKINWLEIPEMKFTYPKEKKSMYRLYNMLVTIKNRNSSNEIIQKD